MIAFVEILMLQNVNLLSSLLPLSKSMLSITGYINTHVATTVIVMSDRMVLMMPTTVSTDMIMQEYHRKSIWIDKNTIN